MKKLLFAGVCLSLLFATSSFKCTKGSLNCEGVTCTMIFAAVGVHIEDRSMTPEALTVYTVRNSTGEKINFTQHNNGWYDILDDSYRSQIAGRTESFTFVGMKGTTKVFSETYQIKADCCHVSKVSGKDTLIIP